MIDWEALTEAEIVRELELGRVTLDQRRARERIPEQVEELARQYLAAENVKPEEPWRQPAGAHNAYPKGWKALHNGTMWESTTPANVWEPGVSGWVESTADDPNAPAPEWLIPTGAHDAYRKGAVVTYGGRTWRSEVGANVWAPGTHGWVIIDPVVVEPVDPTQPEEPMDPEPTTETDPPWTPGVAVIVGEKYVYEGTTYTVVQAHTTQNGWEPPTVASLWEETP